MINYNFSPPLANLQWNVTVLAARNKALCQWLSIVIWKETVMLA
jgi:hypothetical protein